VLICRVLVQAFRGKTLRQTTAPLIENFKQEQLNEPTVNGKKRNPATVNCHLSVLSKIFSLAVDAELIDANPCAKVINFRLNNQRVRVLSGEEEAKLFVAFGDNELVKKLW
jgi:hypothetical protein